MISGQRVFGDVRQGLALQVAGTSGTTSLGGFQKHKMHLEQWDLGRHGADANALLSALAPVDLEERSPVLGAARQSLSVVLQTGNDELILFALWWLHAGECPPLRAYAPLHPLARLVPLARRLDVLF